MQVDRGPVLIESGIDFIHFSFFIFSFERKKFSQLSTKQAFKEILS